MLAKATIKRADWQRMFRGLKLIDWKNEADAGIGVRIGKFKRGPAMGYKDLWEYKFSDAVRIFVERRINEKPLIVLLDPIHAYSDMKYF